MSTSFCVARGPRKTTPGSTRGATAPISAETLACHVLSSCRSYSADPDKLGPTIPTTRTTLMSTRAARNPISAPINLELRPSVETRSQSFLSLKFHIVGRILGYNTP
ncbi:hypothetical protein HanXRQr2_Chr06g0255691 [Helianthus annuus]|uniref:Uncharacterized protein n=1 Tax=Helianthus annuus TaxID=4232 RepID=A0A251UIG0_HELAN|nr:hypothetical protein HanXRQr2_Chr06g0255691 [Helianthus annuus]KAJ0915172.1 hypothetical protein HanPSC8_Chr06g0246881 [Helianthus annuus]